MSDLTSSYNDNSTTLLATMSGLVGYGSSDEEDEVQPERPAKVGSCYYNRLKSMDTY